MKFHYFIPTIHFGPIKHTTYVQELPLNLIEKLIIGNLCILEVIRIIKSEGKIIEESKSLLKFKNNKWLSKEGANFRWLNDKSDNLSYVETQVNIVDGQGVTDRFLPSFYAFYTTNIGKTYLSCSNYKYGNPRTIMQMAEFALWTEGYPSISINRSANTTYSLLVINPYVKTAKCNLEVKELNLEFAFKVKANSAIRIEMSDLIELSEWTGQINISGTQRSVLYFINHEINNFNNTTTIEHSDPFRAENTSVPRFKYLRHNFHRIIKNYINE